LTSCDGRPYKALPLETTRLQPEIDGTYCLRSVLCLLYPSRGSVGFTGGDPEGLSVGSSVSGSVGEESDGVGSFVGLSVVGSSTGFVRV
jgi:hypothetical protein